MKRLHEKLPSYIAVEKFNHDWTARRGSEEFRRTLEIGAGLGEHLKFERTPGKTKLVSRPGLPSGILTTVQESEYWTLELHSNMAAEIENRLPQVRTVVGNCQDEFDFRANCFSRIVAIYLQEHLPDLPAAIKEVRRLCYKERAAFQVVVPCEGSLAYGFCRRISEQRTFEKLYRPSYRWFVEREHINLPGKSHKTLVRICLWRNALIFQFRFRSCSAIFASAMNLRPKPGVNPPGER
jgi:hypothetical protein